MRATVSSTRTVVVPTASTRSELAIRSHASGSYAIPLAEEPVIFDPVGRDRPERVDPDVERDRDMVEARRAAPE